MFLGAASTHSGDTKGGADLCTDCYLLPWEESYAVYSKSGVTVRDCGLCRSRHGASDWILCSGKGLELHYEVSSGLLSSDK
ncbi:Uncharacterized protein HZ326_30456 [Fusarium oxysporum f. sp. albedinis]|nr:Uncharacterized protein HZ326_30456 [Fusarium oxysporum f. sp. albedinis]